jgi:hypothetical protein
MRDILLIARFLFIVFIVIILIFTFIALIFKESRSALIELFKEAKIFLVIAFSVLLIIFLFVGFIITSFFTYSIKYEKREVIEETDETPKIVYRELKEVADKIKTPTKFGDFLGLTYKKDEAKWIISSEKEIILYIPIGSIIENFNPNVE